MQLQIEALQGQKAARQRKHHGCKKEKSLLWGSKLEVAAGGDVDVDEGVDG
jgi:hypothetical protein